MIPFLTRLAAHVAFPTFVVYLALRVNATNFDETEIVTVYECAAAFLAFALAMSLLPARFAGSFKFPKGMNSDAALRAATKAASASAVVLFCSVFIAIALDVRREVSGMREAFLSIDAQTSWTDGGEIRTIRTPRRTGWSVAEWLQAHTDVVRAAKTEEPR